MAEKGRPILSNDDDMKCRYGCGQQLNNASARLTHEDACNKNPNRSK